MITRGEAEARGALVEVAAYSVFLDLSTGGDTFRSRTEVRFGCRSPGAQTFAELDAVAVHRVVLNGQRLDPGAVVSGGRLELPPLAAQNTLTVEADFGYAPDGYGMARFTDPADGAVYLMAHCFPSYAPRLF